LESYSLGYVDVTDDVIENAFW
jgi:hypothetical protein